MSHLYRKYRPKTFQGVRGQDAVIRVLRQKLRLQRLQQVILFTGPSGTGKTTIARLLSKKLNCNEEMDLTEINCAKETGVNMVRQQISLRLHFTPTGGDSRVWILDECHQLSSEAQSALLKTLEDTPPNVYFFLCTTDPHKLLSTLLTRCYKVRLQPLDVLQLEALVREVAGKQRVELTEQVIDEIVALAEGSAREALQLLESVIDLDSEGDQLDALQARDVQANANQLFKALMKPNLRWLDVAAVLRDLDDDPERLRYYIMACCVGVLSKSWNPRARAILREFKWDFRMSLKGGLVDACAAVFERARPKK